MLCLATLAAGCTDEPVDPFAEPTDTATTVATTPPATPTPTPTPVAIDVTTTPDEITPEWVEAVINTILAEYGRMSAEALAIEPPATATPQEIAGPWAADLAELFDGVYLNQRASELVELARNDDDVRSELLPAADFDGLRYTVEVVQYSQPGCIIAVGRYSTAGSVRNGGPADFLAAMSLRPRRAQPDLAVNPTPWMIAGQVANVEDGEPLEDSFMLEANLSVYEGALEHDCVETNP